MRTYCLISQKGGAGKSTLTAHLAALAGEAGVAFMLDRDPQATTTKWWKRRADLVPSPEQPEQPELDQLGLLRRWHEQPELIELDGKALSAVVSEFREQPGSLFVDTRPAVQEPEAEAARAADRVIVPVRPAMGDLEAVIDTLAMLKRIGKAAAIIVNAARNEARATEARAILSQYGVPVCPHFLTDRTVYHDAAAEGRTVMEMRGPAAAAGAAEMRKVWAWIEEMEK